MTAREVCLCAGDTRGRRATSKKARLGNGDLLVTEMAKGKRIQGEGWRAYRGLIAPPSVVCR
ncbi:hypothetical protein Airi01_067690 [Actinoallomurus iriomotensis]|uniref:Uncharacterized protein n=1 Tax=Actinoallomurus iriomotensis TaxID=478107 RepID=A0A9W6VTG7_9ACTN|nr:hypothetical protein Airi01_067690 [Actinoallomurus iriomotensis]